MPLLAQYKGYKIWIPASWWSLPLSACLYQSEKRSRSNDLQGYDWMAGPPRPASYPWARLFLTRLFACNTSMIGCMHVYILVHPSSCLVARLWFRFLCPTLQSLPCEPCAASAEPGSQETLDSCVSSGPGSRRTAAWAEPGSSGCPGNQTARTCICRAPSDQVQRVPASRGGKWKGPEVGLVSRLGQNLKLGSVWCAMCVQPAAHSLFYSLVPPKKNLFM